MNANQIINESQHKIITLKRDEGISLTANAIAWFLRRGYHMTTKKLKKLLNSLPEHEKYLFNTINGRYNFNQEIESSSSFNVSSNNTAFGLLAASFCGFSSI